MGKPLIKPLIRIKNLSRVFHQNCLEIKALDNINLEVESGDFLALVGPSSSGKTTLLNIIAGIDRPTSGSIRVGEVEVQKMSEESLTKWRSKNIGIVFQGFNLIPALTLFENVELPLLLTKLSNGKRRERVLIALDLLDLSNCVDLYPGQLSCGGLRRAAIARAIVADPMIILADKPTANLDEHSAEEILELLCRLNIELNKTIIISTHNMQVARFVKTVLQLDKGTLCSPEPDYVVKDWKPASVY